MLIVTKIFLNLIAFASSINQNYQYFLNDIDLSRDFNFLPDIDQSTEHNLKTSYEPFDELTDYNKFTVRSENVHELWKEIGSKEAGHSYLFYCGDDDPTDISCHNDLENDGLIDVDGEDFTFPEKTIFFVEASCQMGLTFHQVCSIESAARSNPEWQISVLFAGRIPQQCRKTVNFTTLQTYKNVHLHRIHVKKFAEGTPFYNFFSNFALEDSPSPVYHTTEILKYLTLYKWGGIYLDTNMVVARPFENLPFNWIARENADELGTAAIALSKDSIGGLIAKKAVEILARIFCVSKYCANGFGAITQALNETCQIYNVSSQWKSHRCPGFRILESKYFYPLEYFIEHQFTDPNFRLTDAHTYHIWSKSIPEESMPFYQKLAKKFCPQAFKHMSAGISQRLHIEEDRSRTRKPADLATEGLAEPLNENVRPIIPITSKTQKPKTTPAKTETTTSTTMPSTQKKSRKKSKKNKKLSMKKRTKERMKLLAEAQKLVLENQRRMMTKMANST